MVLTRKDYNELRNFIACAFHPDWDETAATYPGVVDTQLPMYDPPTARTIVAEAEALLASPMNDDELASWLGLIGCHVVLEGEGYTARSFIAMIGDRLRPHARG